MHTKFEGTSSFSRSCRLEFNCVKTYRLHQFTAETCSTKLKHKLRAESWLAGEGRWPDRKHEMINCDYRPEIIDIYAGQA